MTYDECLKKELAKQTASLLKDFGKEWSNDYLRQEAQRDAEYEVRHQISDCEGPYYEAFLARPEGFPLSMKSSYGSVAEVEEIRRARHLHISRLPTKAEWVGEIVCAALDIPPLYYETLPVPWKPGFLWGPPESGKTHLSIQRLKGAMRFDSDGKRYPLAIRGRKLYEVNAAFVSVPALVTRLRDFYSNREGGSLENIRRRALTTEFVVLDDIGVSKPSDFVREELYGIVEHRLSNVLPTVVTSNYNIDDLARTLDERLASRLQSFGPIRLLSDKKYRLAKAVYE